MASGPDDLTTKLADEVATDDQQARDQAGDEAELAREEATAARGLLRQAQSVERGLTALEAENRPSPDIAGVSELATGLANYGNAYGKTDLATSPPAPSPAAGRVVVDSSGRYVITSREDLEAVRAAKPTRPDDLDPALEGLWTDYARESTGYFDQRLRAIERDLTTGSRRIRSPMPRDWESYVESRGFYDRLRGNKEFQGVLRDSILAERGDVRPEQAEVDVGLRKRTTVGYADLVITTSSGQLEVYSVKARNVAAQRRRLASDSDVEDWIRDNLDRDVKEAIDKYGGMVTFRRQYQSTATGRGGTRTNGPHPLYNQKVFVNRVILVWRGDSTFVPPEFRRFILTVGNQLGAKYRKTISCEVRLQP